MHFIPLGGATDSCYLEGHSYTYEGSTWGKIVDILISSKCMNPVIYFDELDKISDTKNPEKIMKGIPTHITCKYSHPKFKISPCAPNKDKISFPNNNPIDDSVILIITAITTACSAQLSACFLFSSPIKRAIAAVTPVPRPIVNPSTKKKRGILNAMLQL